MIITRKRDQAVVMMALETGEEAECKVVEIDEE